MSELTDPRTSGPHVVGLNDPEATDPAFVGSKGANLARLVAAGLTVPDGFCVTTVAYTELVDDESLPPPILDGRRCF